MRQGPLSLLFAALLVTGQLHAEELSAAPDSNPPLAAATATQTQIDALEQRLAESEQRRAELAAQLQSTDGERENAQLTRLRQDNQRLKLQLKQAQAEQPARLLSEQQLWFVVGAGVALVALLCGAMLRGRRRTRREWIN
ncbi:translation initiation factor 2 [Pseudomonas sp. 2FE]|uniref:translation initiation factor 2 n=1 Tax=Pseudomonas sp. 2FE TaxID=2502190 RepID=UPI0010F9DC76|nr:translation initiation factor 2 [Pseudomonas sp. 2FE]